MALPSVADRNELTSDYSLQIAIVVCLYTSKGKHRFSVVIFVVALLLLLFPCVACPCDCILYSCGSSLRV